MVPVGIFFGGSTDVRVEACSTVGENRTVLVGLGYWRTDDYKTAVSTYLVFFLLVTFDSNDSIVLFSLAMRSCSC